MVGLFLSALHPGAARQAVDVIISFSVNRSVCLPDSAGLT